MDTTETKPDLVNLNVGGVTFLTTYTTLKTVPDTRLSSVSTKSKEYIAEKELFFFDRNPELFNSVLDYYRTGELHLPKHVCGAIIRNELEYWRINSTSISDCCMSSLFKFEDELEVSNNLKRQFEATTLDYTKEELESSKWNRIKNIVWSVLDKPQTSRLARVYSIVYMSFVLVTCFTFILSTHPLFRQNIDIIHITVNGTPVPVYNYLLLEHGNAKLASLGSTTMVPALEMANNIFTLYFFLDLVLRFVTCPRRRVFSKNWLNIVDLVIVLSLVLSFGLSFKEDIYTSKNLLWLNTIARALIILRLFRLFRFAKHLTGLKVVYLALRVSVKELGLLGLTFIITTSLFGGLIYYAEFFNDNPLDNVPIGMWWAIITLTTIGYGDFVPTSTMGYIVGAICGMCGLLLLSMPIAVIATNFNDYYSQNKIREKQMKRKQHIFNKIKMLFSSKVSDTLRIEQIQVVEKQRPVNGTVEKQLPVNGTISDSAHCSVKNEDEPPPVTPEDKPTARLVNKAFRKIAVKAAKNVNK